MSVTSNVSPKSPEPLNSLLNLHQLLNEPTHSPKPIVVPQKNKIPTNGSSILEKIASELKVNIQGLSLLESSEACFSKVYQLCKAKDWETLKKIKSEVDQLVNNLGQTVLAVAILQKEEIVDSLIDNGFALHTTNEHNKMPIHYAAEAGVLRTFQKIAEKNVVSKEAESGVTALHLASFHGHPLIINFLLTKDPKAINYTVPWNYGEKRLNLTPIAFSIMNGHVDCLEAYLKNEPLSIQTKTKGIGNLLHLAIFFQQNELLRLLLTTYNKQTKMLLEEFNDVGLTPFMMSTYMGNFIAMNLLRKNEVNLNRTDPQGNTALHWAIFGKQENIVSILIKLGVDLRIRNRAGIEPKELAEKIGERSIAAKIDNQITSGSYKDNALLSYEAYPPENLVFQGGGPRGVAFVGVVEELEKNMFSSLLRVAGTSAGSIFAALVAFNYRGAEIKDILSKLNLMDLLDEPKMDLLEAMNSSKYTNIFKFVKTTAKTIFVPSINPFKNIRNYFQNLNETTGICKGDVFRELMEQYIAQKTNIKYCTFKELRELKKKGDAFTHLVVYTMKIGPNQEILRLSSEDQRWDDFIISDAIRGSMSIPGVFIPHRLHIKKDGQRIPAPEEYVVVDGGPLYNLAIESFDSAEYTSLGSKKSKTPVFNKRTLGIALFDPDQKKTQKNQEVKTLQDFLKAITNMYFNSEELIRTRMFPNWDSRVIKVNSLNIGLLNFDLTEDQTKELIKSGKDAVVEFLRKEEAIFANFFSDEKKTDDNNNDNPSVAKIISYENVESIKIGAKSGLYLFVKCENAICKKNQETQKIFKEAKGTIFAEEILAENNCSCCKKPFEKIEKFAFSETNCNMTLRTDTNERFVKFIENQKGRATVINDLPNLNYLKFEF